MTPALTPEATFADAFLRPWRQEPSRHALDSHPAARPLRTWAAMTQSTSRILLSALLALPLTPLLQVGARADTPPAASAPATINAATGAISRGRALHASRCSVCHALDAHGVGPMHRGVWGRRAGSAAGYAYSPALRQSKVVWDDVTLNLWLQDPEAFLPGQRMGVRVMDAGDRADLIAYLSTLSQTEPTP